MTNILITNCTCSHHGDCEYNKGSAAVMVGAIETLKKFIPDVEFTTFVQYSSDFSERYNLKVIPHATHQLMFFSFYDSLRSSFNLFRAALWRILYDYFGINANILVNTKDLKGYTKADIIIDLSMDLYSDDLGTRSVIEHSKDLLCGVLLKKPVVIYAQSTGPFRTMLTSRLARFTLNKVSLITVREEMAMDHLREVGVDKTPIYLTADPAFPLVPTPAERIDRILSIEGIKKDDKPIIGMTLSPVILTIDIKKSKYLTTIKTIYDVIKYFLPEKLTRVMVKTITRSVNLSNTDLKLLGKQMEAILQVIDYLVDELGATVVLIPHTISPESELGPLGDDVTLLKKIYKIKKYKNNVKLISTAYTTEEIKGIIGQCDMFIGSKMHAHIVALSQYIPTVAIAYSYKFHGIMKMLGQEKYICDEITTENLISKINDAWIKKEKIREELKSKVEFVKERSLLNGKLVKELLDSSKAHER